jgi:hypothetical protein
MVKVFTHGYGGQSMNKTATVYSNDPTRPVFELVLSGKVERFVTISPSTIRLFGKVGTPITSTVQILQEDKYPFKLLGPTQAESPNIRYTISSLGSSKLHGYLLTVENRRTEQGRYYERIVLKTDSPLRPEIQIPVHGYLSE